jgi:hypothetical protein
MLTLNCGLPRSYPINTSVAAAAEKRSMNDLSQAPFDIDPVVLPPWQPSTELWVILAGVLTLTLIIKRLLTLRPQKSPYSSRAPLQKALASLISAMETRTQRETCHAVITLLEESTLANHPEISVIIAQLDSIRFRRDPDQSEIKKILSNLSEVIQRC